MKLYKKFWVAISVKSGKTHQLHDSLEEARVAAQERAETEDETIAVCECICIVEKSAPPVKWTEFN